MDIKIYPNSGDFNNCQINRINIEESIKKVYDINMLSVITQVIFYYFGFQKNCVIKFDRKYIDPFL